LYNYCEKCCDTIIPKIENVLNYACWRSCAKEAKSQEKRKNEEKEENQAEPENPDEYKPAENDKVDFKPTSLGAEASFI